MLFFKTVKGLKMAETEFKTFYEQECHICKTTVEVVSRFSSMGDDLDSVLGKLGISPGIFQDLVEGDHCDPDIVGQLCEYLGMDGGTLLKTCPRKEFVTIQQGKGKEERGVNDKGK